LFNVSPSNNNEEWPKEVNRMIKLK